jgi:hypothetical protein
MKKNFVAAVLFLAMLLVSCQLSTQATAEPSATDAAAVIYADQTSTASAQSARATLTAIAPAPSSPTPVQPDNVFNITVPASACWMNSEVNVLTGQTVTITASGIVNTWGGNEISNGDPDGQPTNMCGAIECPLQGANYGALIGALIGQPENLKPFLVGTEVEFTATENGQLYFTVNDWECGDNSGEFELTITIE